MGLGPVHATRRLCEQTGSSPEAFDAVELNEAFAAQSLACLRELKLDPARVNADGGAIAIGHPIGASGARLLVHLARRIARGEVKRGLATLCVGGGMGAAVALVPA
jgi:acetyl-CoA acetyltransferase